MKQFWRNLFSAGPRTLVIFHDMLIVALTFQGLIALRYAMIEGVTQPHAFWPETLIVLAVQLLVFWRVGLYRGLWRFASIPDLINILWSCLIGFALIALAFFFHDRASGVPRFVLLAYPFALTIALGTPRLLYRAWKDSARIILRESPKIRLLIIGAGSAGETLARELMRSTLYVPIGFIDDDRALRGAKLYGLPVLGTLEDLPTVANETAAGMIAIAMPHASTQTLRDIVGQCEKTRLPFRSIPTSEDVLQGARIGNDLKEVAIEDLLGRDPVVPDWVAIRKSLVGRSILITGAGGSIGSELCRQCAAVGVAKLILVEQSEFSLTMIQQEFARKFPAVELLPVLGDCGDPMLIKRALEWGRPDEVFHAAAYKQVPLLETHPREAIRNNALATEVVVKASVEAGVEIFVLISTDKAVNPANMLGASKRLAEMACQALTGISKTQMVIVRFGNVLDSAGSVVPLFRDQIRNGGPVTVTHPEVTRFFMTIPEACQLILQATTLREAPGVFTLDMGKPVHIRLLAEQMILLAGLTPDKDIPIVYTGLRPGEKLHESLFHPDESYRQTAHAKIFLAELRHVDSADTLKVFELLRHLVAKHDQPALLKAIADALPDFEPAATQYEETAGFKPHVIQGGRVN